MRAERASGGLHSHVASKIRSLQTDLSVPILDVGCGTGAFLARLQKLGYSRLSGADIAVPSPTVDGIEFKECDLDSGCLPFQSASFALITSVEVFEHIENIGMLLGEISRIMKPDGSLLITTPNVHSIEARLRFLLLDRLKQFDELGDPTHIFPIILHPFKRILARHQLEIAEIWGFPIDGSSPTSRGVLRALTRAASAMGVKSKISGDNLCLLIRHRGDTADELHLDKRVLVTSHY